MKKPTTPQTDVWNETVEDSEDAQVSVETVKTVPTSLQNINAVEYDMEGLMTDFPTAKELERFVYDQTGIILNVKGLANKVKYQIAMDTLNGTAPEQKYLTAENPYLEKSELIPEDPLKPIPQRDKDIPPVDTLQSLWHQTNFPHPDFEMRAQDAKVRVCFRKYNNGTITYEVEGPIEQHPVGEKLDKFGRSRPEKLVWVDPRTGEQVLRYNNGTFTKTGMKLYSFCKSQIVNKDQSIWDVWIDRDISQFNQDAVDNPWDE